MPDINPSAWNVRAVSDRLGRSTRATRRRHDRARDARRGDPAADRVADRPNSRSQLCEGECRRC